PTRWLGEAEVWEALLDRMPLTAMVRSLARMTAVGLLAPRSAAARTVCDRLGDVEHLKKARVHPLALLVALSTYAQGKGKGSLTWQPVQTVADALDEAFYTAFAAVEPTGERWMLALDVSGSMACGSVAGSPLTPRDTSAALALVTAATERAHHVV